MFTLSKINPELTYDSDAHFELGNKLKEIGGRILLISSVNQKDKTSLLSFKKVLKNNNITFIQCDLPQGIINSDELNKLLNRAESFSVTSIVALGDISERMSGRYIANKLLLNYFELLTTFNNPYLLIPKSVFSNRVGDEIEVVNFSNETINGIYIDINYVRILDEFEIILNSLAILLDLSHLFINKRNNIISSTQSKILFLSLLDDIENDNLTNENLFIYGITTALYHGASTDIELNLTIYSLMAGYRFKCNPHILSSKLLPWYLDTGDDESISLRIREVLDRLKISCRLTDLGFTLKQLTSINSSNSETMAIIEKAF